MWQPAPRRARTSQQGSSQQDTSQQDTSQQDTSQQDSGQQGISQPGSGRPSQPSWPHVVATTVQLYLRRRRHAVRWIAVVCVLIVVLAAAGLGVLLARSTSPQAGHGPAATSGLSASVSARAQAAAWIKAQVSQATIVACDPVMCSVLQSHGFPSANLEVLRPGALDPLDSDLIVATPVLRSQFGGRLQSVYAPMIIASFGAGAAAVQVRVIAPDGAPAYLQQLNSDFAARKAVGSGLLHNPKVVTYPSARGPLAAGLVDTRLLTTVATMAELYPLRIVAFGDASPDANPMTPLRSATLVAGNTGQGSAAALARMRSFLTQQQSPFLPALIEIVRLPSGQTALHFQFTAPSQLGLLNSGIPSTKTPSN
jgi:hypothetical protein